MKNLARRHKLFAYIIALAIVIALIILSGKGCDFEEPIHQAPAQSRNLLTPPRVPSEQSLYTIGDPRRTPDLFVVETVSTCDPYAKLVGLRGGNWFTQRVLVELGDFYNRVYHITPGWRWVFVYECPIGNRSWPRRDSVYQDSSGNDFVSDRQIDGIADSVYTSVDYNFPGMLSIELFMNGEEHAAYKQNFYVDNTNCLDRIDPPRFYGSSPGHDTMRISPRWADKYYNTVEWPLNSSGGIDTGLAVLKIELNESGIVNEWPIDPPEYLPLHMDSNGHAILDWRALGDNSPKQPSNLVWTRSNNGKIVTLNWSGNAEYFQIMRDSIIVSQSAATTFVDNVMPSRKTIQYSVRAGNDFGLSAWTSITVTRK
jgi:hypothetical protein